MRLSEAILLGSVSVPQGIGSKSMCSPTERCALGAALFSVGFAGDISGAFITVKKQWPWLNNVSSCPVCLMPRPELTYEVIYHLNDSHCWTRERIAEWVASIEPPDPQEVKEAFETVREMPEETFAERFEQIHGCSMQEWDRKLSIHRHGV